MAGGAVLLSMRFIILGNDIYPVGTAQERAHAASHMVDAGVDSVAEFQGGPTNADETGRDFLSTGYFFNKGRGR